MLLVHGSNSYDIFKALLSVLRGKCEDFFGETLNISNVNFDEDVKPLKEYFETLGIKLVLNLSDSKILHASSTTCALKDYKLVLKLPRNYHLSISFDYDMQTSTPCHLE